MSNPATSALFAHRTEISVGARKAIFVDLQMVPYGQSGHRILALIPPQSEAELMGGVTGRPGRAAGAAASMLAHEIKNPLAGIQGAATPPARKPAAAAEPSTPLTCAEVDRIPPRTDQMAHFSRGQPGRPGPAAGAPSSMPPHQIKNPPAGIKGAAQLLARKTDAGGERFTTLICAEVDRIATLIDQMEHFSRGQPVACSAINLYPPIHQAMEAARARQVPSVRFIEDFDPSLPLVLGNHDAMVQILLNLVTNACEALGGRDDAVVRIATAYRHGLSIDNDDGRGRIAMPLELSVSDTGPGVHRSEEHTSELQSLMRISYAVFCWQTKKHNT